MEGENAQLLPKEVAQLFGYKEDITINEFKEKFPEEFIKRENIFKDEKLNSELHGRVFGVASQDLKRTAKDIVGVEISKDEIKSNKIEELFDVALNRTKEKYESELSSLRAQSGTETEAVSALKEENEILKSKYSEINHLLESSKTQWANEKSEIEQNIYKRDLGSYKGTMFSFNDYKDGIKDVELLGVQAKFDSLYEIHKDKETGSWYPTNKEGKMIENPDVLGEFIKDPKELARKLVLENELVKKNVVKTESKEYKPTTETVNVEEVKPSGIARPPLRRNPYGS